MDWPCVLYNTNIGIVWRRRKQRPQSTTKIISASSLNSSSSKLLILLLLAMTFAGELSLWKAFVPLHLFSFECYIINPASNRSYLALLSLQCGFEQNSNIQYTSACIRERSIYRAKTLPFQENISYFRKRYKRIKLEKVPLAESVINLFQRFTIFHNIGILKLKFMFKYKRQSRNENYLWKLNKYACL